jgi:hypothetical protein
MKNGDDFLAFIEDTADFLNKKTVIEYYRQPLPSPTDEEIARIVGRFMAATPEQRAALSKSLTKEHRSLLGIYGHRAATLSVRQGSPEKLLNGLVGTALANYVIPDTRNIKVALAVPYHCAQKLGLDPAEIFAEAAQYASWATADILVDFGRRHDVSLKKFGWRELQTAEGVRYKFDWA